MTFLRYDENEYGTKVGVYICDSCNTEFTVCPAPTNHLGWSGCTAPDCMSYDASRDVDKMFDEGVDVDPPREGPPTKDDIRQTIRDEMGEDIPLPELESIATDVQDLLLSVLDTHDGLRALTVLRMSSLSLEQRVTGIISPKAAST